MSHSRDILSNDNNGMHTVLFIIEVLHGHFSSRISQKDSGNKIAYISKVYS